MGRGLSKKGLDMKNKKKVSLKFDVVSALFMFPLFFMLFRYISRGDTYDPIAIFGAAGLFLIGMIIAVVNNEF